MQQANNSTNANPLTSGPLLPTIMRLSLPMLVSNFLQTAFFITDMIFIGRLGPDAIAGVSMSGTIIHMVMTLVIGVDLGMRAMISRFYGADDAAMARRVAGQALLMGGVLTVILASNGVLWRREILIGLGAEPAVVQTGSAYLKILFSGILTMVFMFFISGILNSIGDARTPMRVAAIAFVINTALDPLLIFGWGPIPAMGVEGAAWATISGRGIGGILLLRALFSQGNFRVHLADLKPDLALIGRILRIAVPGSLQIGCYSLSEVISMRLITPFGTTAIAAFGVAGRSVMFLLIGGFALSGAVGTMVGQNLGAGKPQRAIHSVWIITGLYTLVLLVAALIYYQIAPTIISLFTQDLKTQSMGSETLRIFSLGFGFLALNIIVGRALQGAGDTLSPLAITAICRLPMLLSLMYYLPHHWNLGINGLWYSFVITNILEGLLKTFWFQTGRWKKTKV